MRDRFIDLKNWLKNHPKSIILTLLIVVLAGSGATWALRYKADGNDQRVDRNTSTREEEPLTKPSPLTGIEVEPQAADEPVTAVMIENSPNARPQSGLDAADIVFEAVAEGGITRFMALFQSQAPDTVGPIRSLRPYYLDWLMGFDAAVAHVGGSGKALQLVDRRGAKSLNQFSHSGPYYRSSDRISPHNMYSSLKDLRSLQKRLGYDKSEFPLFERSEDEPAEEPKATTINIDYSSSLYQAQFRYNREDNDYSRHMAGNVHNDRETGKPITVENVVVVKMPTSSDGQYAIMDTIGSGDAVLFKNGRAHNIRWRQKSYNDRIELLDSEGEEVSLNQGQSWFAILPSDKTLDY